MPNGRSEPACALQIQLTNIEAARLQLVHPAKPDAQELAMRCQAAYMNFGQFGELAEAAFRLCEQALEIDPDNVTALATLAIKFFSRPMSGHRRRRREAGNACEGKAVGPHRHRDRRRGGRRCRRTGVGAGTSRGRRHAESGGEAVLAVVLAITKLLWMRDRSVVRLSVMPSAK